MKGLKFHVQGRLQGVEMAKTEVTKFGKISLHVFSSKVDYAEAKASTNFGILGVKVWICYDLKKKTIKCSNQKKQNLENFKNEKLVGLKSKA